jgi:hypothetical protein
MRFTELRKPARPPRTYPVRKRAPPTNRGGRGRSLGPRISCREEHNTTRPSPTHRKTPARKESPGRRTQPGLGKCSRPHARRTVRYPGKVEGRLPRRALCCRIMLSGRAPVYGWRFLPRTLPLGSFRAAFSCSGRRSRGGALQSRPGHFSRRHHTLPASTL